MQTKTKQQAQEYIDLDLGDYLMSERQRIRIAQAERSGTPIQAFVLSCPAYGSNGDIYTFDGLSGEVPMMTKQHLEGLEPLVQKLLLKGARLIISVLVADVEALNESLTQRYTNGDGEAYMDYCQQSVNSIYNAFHDEYNDRGVAFESSSFLTAFESKKNDGLPSNKFLEARDQYKGILMARFVNDRSFASKVTNTIRSRINDKYYVREYGETKILPMPTLIDRELTTMSEYMALGKLIGETSCQPLIVIHNSNNTYLLNEGNTFDAYGEATNRASLPLLIRQKRVY